MAERTVSSWGQYLGGLQKPEGAVGPEADRRTWKRFLCDVATAIRLASSSQGSRLPARICNISQGGVNLLVNRSFERGTILSIDLPAVAGQPACTLLGCVAHVAKQNGDHWSVGCTFVSELSEEELHVFGAERLRPPTPDKRGWVRFTCDMQAMYRPVRMTERKKAPAKVFDISVSGVGLLVQRSLEVGTLLSLELLADEGRSPLKMLACVVRVTPHGDEEWALGCNFIREIGDQELKAFLPGKR